MADAGGAFAAGRPAAPVWSVAALVAAVGDTLTARFAVCTVEGEISGFTRASSGHCYFSLKDAQGQAALLRCAMFRRAALLADFAVADGQRVEVRGRVAVYEPRGELQFIVEAMRRAGAGSLHEQFLQLRAKLAAEGLFDTTRKRALPRHARRVGVVTSLAGAALHDVTSAFARRAPQVELIVYPTPVQGLDAPASIVAAIATAVRRAEVDLLIVCRGGGSLEDLWAFNDERTVRAVAACALPVICGVGHETDVSLADFAADVRAPTPTAAAELAAPARDDCLAALQTLAAALHYRLQRALDTQRQRCDRAGLRLARPADLLRREGQALALLAHRLGGALRQAEATAAAREGHAAQRLQRAAAALQARHAQRLDSLAARLALLDPRQVLARGYAWLTDAQGAAVPSVASLKEGDTISATLADGDVRATVRSIQPRLDSNAE
jgi:exodeoxyribonuclease VII large subunit